MLIDSHCHLVDKRYVKSVPEMIQDARSWGVTKFITIGTSIKESEVALQTAKAFEEVYATVGIYPHEEKGAKMEKLHVSLQELLGREPNAVAVGECGIDISNRENERKIDEQIELFEMQVELSIENDLPLSIHNRNGDETILNSLRKYPKAKGVFHCFSSNWEFAKKALDMGFYISFSGVITYPSAKQLLETVEKVPLDKFLLETDSPYLPPQDQRGTVNTPRNVKIIAQSVAKIKKMSFDEVCKYSYDNTHNVFNL